MPNPTAWFLLGMVCGCVATVCAIAVLALATLARGWAKWLDRLVALENNRRKIDDGIDREREKAETIHQIAEIRSGTKKTG